MSVSHIGHFWDRHNKGHLSDAEILLCHLVFFACDEHGENVRFSNSYIEHLLGWDERKTQRTFKSLTKKEIVTCIKSAGGRGKTERSYTVSLNSKWVPAQKSWAEKRGLKNPDNSVGVSLNPDNSDVKPRQILPPYKEEKEGKEGERPALFLYTLDAITKGKAKPEAELYQHSVEARLCCAFEIFQSYVVAFNRKPQTKTGTWDTVKARAGLRMVDFLLHHVVGNDLNAVKGFAIEYIFEWIKADPWHNGQKDGTPKMNWEHVSGPEERLQKFVDKANGEMRKGTDR